MSPRAECPPTCTTTPGHLLNRCFSYDWPGYETSLQAKVHIGWIVIEEKWIRTAVELVVQSAVE